MRGTGKGFWPVILVLSLCFGGGFFVYAAGPPATTLNLPSAGSGLVLDDDDDKPEVTARVARISFIRGEARIRHAGGSDWEKVTLNLPIVEGDEISTDPGSRVEIQFGNFEHLRLDENAFLKVVGLKDEGIAVSISLGTMNVRITEFDKDRSFFEIDAPKTTIAVQKSGAYRIDAGQAGDAEIRMIVTEGGEARMYSDTAGFTLKNDRGARLFIDGAIAGEWQADEASRFSDEFDAWALDRDMAIAKRLADAHYNKYYDQDIYGADDLNGYGEWVYTNNYGYVWRPYTTAINAYADWSPYRYGHWRWVPPFGWTWINDEPWGWATYHHGRWFWDAGYWYWSPYGYYRYSRSWWSPALVVVNIFNSNVFWYPLPYHCHYYNYNWHHNHHGGHHGGGHYGPLYQTGGIKPIPTRTPTANNTARNPQTGGIKTPPVTTVPTKAVIGVAVTNFGTSIKGGQTPPTSIASAVLVKPPADTDPPQLPSYSVLTGKIGSDIIRQKPKTGLIAAQTKVGAATRQPGEPLDKELRNSRVLGGRPPVAPSGGTDTRPTGAVVRPPVVRNDSDPLVKQPPVYSPPIDREPQGPPVKQPPRSDPPVRAPPTRSDPPVKQPSYNPPPTRSEPSPVRTPTRSEPPPTKSEPKPPTPTKSDGGGGKAAKAD